MNMKGLKPTHGLAKNAPVDFDTAKHPQEQREDEMTLWVEATTQRVTLDDAELNRTGQSQSTQLQRRRPV
jgi:hypothetical protein